MNIYSAFRGGGWSRLDDSAPLVRSAVRTDNVLSTHRHILGFRVST